MTDLSPAAQAVLDAMHEVNTDFDGENATLAAAALRAAADQVVPEDVIWTSKDAQVVGQDIRERLLAIAAELETSTTENR